MLLLRICSKLYFIIELAEEKAIIYLQLKNGVIKRQESINIIMIPSQNKRSRKTNINMINVRYLKIFWEQFNNYDKCLGKA